MDNISQELMDSLSGSDLEVVYRNGDAVVRRRLNDVRFKRTSLGHIIVVGQDPALHNEPRAKRVADLEDMRMVNPPRRAA